MSAEHSAVNLISEGHVCSFQAVNFKCFQDTVRQINLLLAPVRCRYSLLDHAQVYTIYYYCYHLEMDKINLHFFYTTLLDGGAQ